MRAYVAAAIMAQVDPFAIPSVATALIGIDMGLMQLTRLIVDPEMLNRWPEKVTGHFLPVPLP